MSDDRLAFNSLIITYLGGWHNISFMGSFFTIELKIRNL
jgi:hypothetical protein